MRQFLPLFNLFPFLRSSVLEPDLDLAFGQTQVGCQLGFSTDGDVSAVVELFFEFHSLVVGVHYSIFVFCSCFAWKLKFLVMQFLQWRILIGFLEFASY